jgi:hypothetical protein
MLLELHVVSKGFIALKESCYKSVDHIKFNYLQGMCMISCVHNKFHKLFKQQIGLETISCYNSYACIIVVHFYYHFWL